MRMTLATLWGLSFLALPALAQEAPASQPALSTETWRASMDASPEVIPPLGAPSLVLPAATDPALSLSGANPNRYPWASALFSVCTGCGHAYAGERREGAMYLGSSLLLLGGGRFLGGQESEGAFKISGTLLTGWQNLKFYSAFDAFRDSRRARLPKEGEIEVTSESLASLSLAPVTGRVIKSRWVWLGVPLALGVATSSIVLLADDVGASVGSLRLGLNAPFSRGASQLTAGEFLFEEAIVFATVDAVAVGEEALFRGVIQTSLEERLGRWGGWAAGSLIFGGVHVVNFIQRDSEGAFVGIDPIAKVALPAITFTGSLMGLAYMKTDHKLATSVAMHFWYDAVLFSLSALSGAASDSPAMLRVSLPW